MTIETQQQTQNRPFSLRAKPYQLADFWEIPLDQRIPILKEAILETHAWHYPRNTAYRHVVSAHGIGATIKPEDFPLVLRPTAQTFKSYIELLGTPFPQDKPHAFLSWLSDQLSLDLPKKEFTQFEDQYKTLETLLSDIERIYAPFGFELITSSGTSGRATIMVRDQEGIDKTVESFYLAFQRYMGMQADHRAIFIMPRVTRIAMVRMATFSVKRVGLSDERVHFTIPFPAYPDQVRIRSGRTYRPGFAGLVERKISNPLMNWMSAKIVEPRTLRSTLEIVQKAVYKEEKIILFGGWAHLHQIALQLKQEGQTLRLAPGSLLGSGGGMKELYPFSPAQIRKDVADVFTLPDGESVPIRDAYGMAEGNWAALQCQVGNYHIPPWVYAVTLDDNGNFQDEVDATGVLAFFDPFGGSQLFPAFFRTSDRVRLINGGSDTQSMNPCACGDQGAYIQRESILRVDLLDEAGCAAQI